MILNAGDGDLLSEGNSKRTSVISSVILIVWQVKIVEVNGNQNPHSEYKVNWCNTFAYSFSL